MSSFFTSWKVLFVVVVIPSGSLHHQIRTTKFEPIFLLCLTNIQNIKILFPSLAVFGQKTPNRQLLNPKKTEGLLEKLLDTFLLSVTCRGNIVLISSSVEKYLGHCRVSRTFIVLISVNTLNVTNATRR